MSKKEDPSGFITITGNIGIRDETPDFMCLSSDRPCAVAGVFTQSRFAGPSVEICRRHIEGGRAQAIVAISKNANVATGAEGLRNAELVVERVAEQLGVSPEDVLIASTGVIGRQYPMDRVLRFLGDLRSKQEPADFDRAARAIMTTDLVEKCARARVGNASVVGIAKGVGMMEPNMATLLTFFATDADIPAPRLDAMFRRVVDKTFNCLSVDTDTSTSDSAIILANGVAGPVDEGAFEEALLGVATRLVRTLARDGEGATKLLEVVVDGATDGRQAKRVAKAIVNSPLVKTAVHGADPNWGRVAMAIGKCSDETTIDPEKVTIRFSGMEVFPSAPDAKGLERLEELLRAEEVTIHVSLGLGPGESRVWGCDLSAEYVRINGEYST